MVLDMTLFFKRLIFLISASLVLAGPAEAIAAPLSNSELKALYNDSSWFVPGVGSDSCLTAANLTGSEITEKVYNFLIGKGLTPPQASGIMGNLQEESGINPRRVQGAGVIESDVMALDGKTGYGLAQWTSLGRQKGLHEAALAAGVKDSDLKVQLDYLWMEMGTSQFSKNGFERLKASQDVREVTSIFMLDFERPKDQSQAAQNKRAALSLAWLAEYGSSTTSGTVANSSNVVGSCRAGGVATVLGNYSLPLEQKYYDENKAEFTKPHHTYPAADLRGANGRPVFSMTDGKIIKAPTGGDCGRGVLIEDADKVQYTYCHGPDGGSIPGAKVGDIVKAGQLIMHTGVTGDTSGPHLHVGIKFAGKNRCPQTMFVGIVEGSVPNPKELPTSGCVEGTRND